jgi:hypothetical protein
MGGRHATGRYLRHEARFGPAIFDAHEVITMEKSGDRARAPRRAVPCRCRSPYGVLSEGRCWACGRWVL